MKEQHKKIGCIVMASGLSVRFGSNKLFARFRGQTLLERTLSLTAGDLFTRRLVLTRSPEAAQLCRERGVEVVLHTLTGRGDAVRLGVETLGDMDAILFCPCDQPLLRRESLERLTAAFGAGEGSILRLSTGERVGTPVLFERRWFEELRTLPSGKGGAYLARQHPEAVRLVQAADPLELEDVDTPEDLERLRKGIF